MIPLVVFLLACVAVVLGSIEAAFSTLMRLSLRLAAERSDRPGALGAYLDDPLLLFVPVRFLLALVTAAATALLATGIGIEGTPTVSFVAVTVVAFIAVFELLLPRLIVARDPEGILELLLPVFTPVAYALGPVTRWMTPAPALAATRRAIPPVGDEAAETDVPSEAAKTDAGPAEHEGTIEGEERRLLQNIMDFGGTLVREVMTPRPDIVALPENATIGELRAVFREQEYSRFPVFRESLDNIVGFAFIKDLVALDASEDARAIRSIVRPAVVVPETKRVPELLKQFQRQQTQIAIVVDEYGGTAGLVTIEDLLEEIVGEIRDEYDVESESVVDEGNGRFVFSGKVDVDEIARRLDVHIEREGFETVGGYLLSHLGRVPTVGERFDIDGLRVEVLDAERRRVNKVRIVKHEEPVEAEPSHGS
jgi:CBS domain containing-hemolysin-like protein